MRPVHLPYLSLLFCLAAASAAWGECTFVCLSRTGPAPNAIVPEGPITLEISCNHSPDGPFTELSATDATYTWIDGDTMQVVHNGKKLQLVLEAGEFTYIAKCEVACGVLNHDPIFQTFQFTVSPLVPAFPVNFTYGPPEGDIKDGIFPEMPATHWCGHGQTWHWMSSTYDPGSGSGAEDLQGLEVDERVIVPTYVPCPPFDPVLRNNPPAQSYVHPAENLVGGGYDWHALARPSVDMTKNVEGMFVLAQEMLFRSDDGGVAVPNTVSRSNRLRFSAWHPCGTEWWLTISCEGPGGRMTADLLQP